MGRHAYENLMGGGYIRKIAWTIAWNYQLNLYVWRLREKCPKTFFFFQNKKIQINGSANQQAKIK